MPTVALDALASELTALEDFVPPLSLFCALGVERDELRHSDLLAALLRPRVHRHAEPFLRLFLKEIADGLRRHALGAATLLRRCEAASSGPILSIKVDRELDRIDLVLVVNTGDGPLVFGIENKIDAAEGPQQVARYQRALQLAYPGCSSAVLFLTPSGRLSTTADDTAPVPYVPLGYGCLERVVASLLADVPGTTAEHRVLTEFLDHLRGSIMATKTDHKVEERVRAIWREHGTAAALLVAHRPKLADIQSAYEAGIRARFGSDVSFGHYPDKGELREIKFQLKTWKAAGLPLTFMLYGYPPPSRMHPAVRVWVFEDDFARVAGKLQKWAKATNAKDGPAIDEEFRPLKFWSCWRRVLAEPDYPETSFCDDVSFGPETARWAVDHALALVERLQPHVPL